jgi:type IV secretory pathway VirJ component
MKGVRAGMAKKVGPKPRGSSRLPLRAAPGTASAAAFSAQVNAAIEQGEPDAVSDQTLHAVLAAAVRVYAAKVERRGGTVKPFADGAVTATEAIIAACGMVRAVDLSPFDVAMWFHRMPAQ